MRVVLFGWSGLEVCMRVVLLGFWVDTRARMEGWMDGGVWGRGRDGLV